MARAWARRSRSSPTGGFPGRRAGCASVMCRQNRSSGARWRWCAKATASGSMPLHAAWIFLLTTRNSQSGEKPGSLDRRGIARARSPNTRVWSGRRLVAPSPMMVRRIGRSSIHTQKVAHRDDAGDHKLPIKAGITPNLRVNALGEWFGGIPNIREANIKWREAKAHKVRGPEIADHAALDHRLDHRIALIEGYPDLAAAQRGLARGHDVKIRQQRTDARHEQLREREALLSQSRHLAALHRVKAGLHTAAGDDRLGSAEKTFDACVGPEITIKGKGGGVSPPARQWMLCRGLMGFCDGNKGRRARTSVQIFVSATDREVDGIKVECDFHHADRMAEVPHHQRAGVVQLFGNGGHVK